MTAINDFSSTKSIPKESTSFGLTFKQLQIIFPYHVRINSQFVITQVGINLSKLFPMNESTKQPFCIGKKIDELFHCSSPNRIVWDFNRLRVYENSNFSFDLKDSSMAVSNRKIPLIGGVIFCDPQKDPECTEFGALFLLNLRIFQSTELLDLNFTYSDLSRYGFQKDLVLASEHLQTEVNMRQKLEQIKKSLEQEKSKTIALLETKRYFVRYVSHEIRTPLNIVVTGLKYFKEMITPWYEKKILQSNKLQAKIEEFVQFHSNKVSQNVSLAPATIPLSDNPRRKSSVGSISRSTSAGDLYIGSNINDDEEEEDRDEIIKHIMADIPMILTPTISSSKKQPISRASSDTEISNKSKSLSTKNKSGNNNNNINNESIDINYNDPEMEEIENALTDMMQASAIAVDILNDLLLYEKIEGNLLKMEFEEINTKQLVFNIVHLFKIQAISKEINIYVDLDSVSNIYIKADVGKFSQVLRNLMSNALKFTPAGGFVEVIGEILVKNEHNDDYILLVDSKKEKEIEENNQKEIENTNNNNNNNNQVTTESTNIDDSSSSFSHSSKSITGLTPLTIAALSSHYGINNNNTRNERNAGFIRNRRLSTFDELTALTEKNLDDVNLCVTNTNNSIINLESSQPNDSLYQTSTSNNQLKSIHNQNSFTISLSGDDNNDNNDSQQNSFQRNHKFCPTPNSSPKNNEINVSEIHSPLVPSAPKQPKQPRPTFIQNARKVSVPHSHDINNTNTTITTTTEPSISDAKVTDSVPTESGLEPSTVALNGVTGAVDKTTVTTKALQSLSVSSPSKSIDISNTTTNNNSNKNNNENSNKSNKNNNENNKNNNENSSGKPHLTLNTSIAIVTNDNNSNSTNTTHTTIETSSSALVHNPISSLSSPNKVKLSPTTEIYSAVKPFQDDEREYKYKVRISIKDSGRGIALDDQNNLFQEFIQVRANKTQDGGGSGLGLWVSRKIVEAHSGSIHVYSEGEINKGSTFYFDIPVAGIRDPSGEIVPNLGSLIGNESSRNSSRRNSLTSSKSPYGLKTKVPESVALIVKDTHKDSNSNSNNNSTSNSNSNNNLDGEIKIKSGEFNRSAGQISVAASVLSNTIETMLIVDDSSINRKMMKRLFSGKCNRIDEAVDGRHAINKVNAFYKQNNQNVYDVIMMDFIMPTMNGPDCVRELRKQGYEGLIIGVTGNSQESDIEIFNESGVNKVMIKPLDSANFMTYTIGWLQRNEDRRRLSQKEILT